MKMVGKIFFFSYVLYVNKFCWNVDGICRKKYVEECRRMLLYI